MSILIKNAGADYSKSGLLYSKALKLAFETYKTASNADAIRIAQKYDPNKVLWFYNNIDLSGNVLEFAYVNTFFSNSELGRIEFDVIDLTNKRRVVLTYEAANTACLRYITETIKKKIILTTSESTFSNSILYVKLDLANANVIAKTEFFYNRATTLTISSTSDETDTAFTDFSNPNLANGIRIQGDKNFSPISGTVYRFRGLRITVDDRDVFAGQTLTDGNIHDWVSGKNFDNVTIHSESYVGDTHSQIIYMEIKKSNESL